MGNGQKTNSSPPLTSEQQDALVARAKTAWANLPPGTQAAIKPLLENAHQQLGDFLDAGKAIDHSVHAIIGLKSHLTGDWDGHLQRLHQPIAGEAIEVTVGPGGQIIGTGKYQGLDL